VGIFKQDPASNVEWTTGGTFATEWRFVTDPIPYIEMDLTFPLMRFSSFEGGVGSGTGELDLDFAQMQCIMTASTNDRTGDIDCTFDQMEMEGVASRDTIDIALTFEQPEAEMHAGAHMALTFLNPEIQLQESGNFMDLTFQPMDFEAHSYDGEIMNQIDGVFKEMDMFATGRNSYNFMSLTFMRPTIEMKTGHYMELTFEKMTADINGIAGITGNLNLKMRPLDAQLVGGPPPYIDLEFKEMEMEMGGDNEILANLVLNMEYPILEMTGMNDIVGNLDLRMMPMRLDMRQDLVHPIGSMSCVMREMTLKMTAIQGLQANLVAHTEKLECEMFAHYDGINDLDLTIPEMQMQMSSGLGMAGTNTCDLADTLEFGD